MAHELPKLAPCPMCGGTKGYTLHDGSTYRWWVVQCADCGRDVSECRSNGSTNLHDPKPERWNAADESWNDAGAHAAALAAEVERLTACLYKANSQAELFERKWYLRGDEIERLRDALKTTWNVIDGLQNLVNGVQLGPVSWYVKASDARALSEAALANRA